MRLQRRVLCCFFNSVWVRRSTFPEKNKCFRVTRFFRNAGKMKLYQTLEEQLKKEPNYVSDSGELKKWVILNKAQNFNEELIGLLLNNPDLKNKFFIKVKNPSSTSDQDIWYLTKIFLYNFSNKKNISTTATPSLKIK